MSFNPLISLARNAKRQRMEMQCDPQWVLDLAAERDQLRAERDSHQRLCIAEMKKNSQLRAELEAIRGQQPDAVSVPSDTALRRAAKFLAGIDNGCNEVKTLRALVANAQVGKAVSVPRELLGRVVAILGSQGFSAWDELAAEVLTSTKNAEEGE